ncbi:MAG: hypothetical protein ACREM3_02250 [Candidatus Rokuibacteriota bacterium]
MNELSGAGRRVLDARLARGGSPGPEDVRSLAALDPDALDAALAAFAAEHGAAAVPLLSALADQDAGRGVRRAARRALYRLEQRGIRPPELGPPRPVVAGRHHARAVRAWLSGVDGSGSRAAWILFEGDWGALRLCSLILNDVAGILDVAGGDVTKKRLDRELARLRAEQKLPWVEVEAARAVGLVTEALALHLTAGGAPPAAFSRWQTLFAGAAPAPPPAPAPANEALVERSAELLELSELAGWFLEPEAVQRDALERLQARESRLVVSDELRREREEALLRRVVERELDAGARRRWARRLLETALVLDAVDREEHAGLARAAAAALLDDDREAWRIPFARGLATRALDVAGEVSAGRLSAAEVSRKPAARPPA